MAGAAFAQGVPATDPLSPQQNIFYGETPADGHAAPILVFVHGVNSRAADWWFPTNDMYALAFNAGYRTAFISLNPDNSRDIDAIPANVPVVRAALPAISAHFGGETLYLVAHSKGGLDLQAALLDTPTARLVKAVFTVGTPNQGTELADWAFGPGQALASSLGLLNPAVASITTGAVGQVRPSADLAFAAFGIPFYTIAGSSFAVPANPLTSNTGPVLASLTGGQPNDGIVTVARTKLPETYAADLGTLPVSHFALATGSLVFPRINAQVRALEQTRGFRKIAGDGFSFDEQGNPLDGDPYNTYPLSATWFKGRLYVGTNRAATCVSMATADAALGSHTYATPDPALNCTPEAEDLPLRAEIWRYTPKTRVWERVYQSPEDVPIEFGDDGEPARFTARDVGFRDMIVFRETAGRPSVRQLRSQTAPLGKERLYVAGVSTSSLFDTLPGYAGGVRRFPPPRLLWTDNGVEWHDVPQLPGTFLGDIGAHQGQVKERGFRSFAAVRAPNGENQLYVTVTDLKGVGRILMSTRPSRGNNDWRAVSPPAEDFPVYTIHGYRNQVYLSTTLGGVDNPVGYGIFRTDGFTPDPSDPSRLDFVPVALPTGDLTFPPKAAVSMEEFQGSLYVGSDRPTELLRIHPDDSWDLVIGTPRLTDDGLKTPLSGIGMGFDSMLNGHFYAMAAHNGSLYMGTWDWSEMLGGTVLESLVRRQLGFDLFKSTDGVSWTVVTRNGIDDPTSAIVRNMVSTPYGLFIGAANLRNGLQIYQLPDVLDLNRDGVVDATDAGLIASAVTPRDSGLPPTQAGDDDPRDINGDGLVTRTDQAALRTQCTNPRCAGSERPVVPPPTSLVALPASTTTSVVPLVWQPSPAAVRYHLYRADPTTLDNAAPPDLAIPLPGGQTVTVQQIRDGVLNAACNTSVDEMSLCPMVQALQSTTLMLKPPHWVGTTIGLSFNAPMLTGMGQALYHVVAEDAFGNLSAPSNVVPGP